MNLQVYLSDGLDYDGPPDPGIDDTLLVTIDLVNVEEPGTVTVSRTVRSSANRRPPP